MPDKKDITMVVLTGGPCGGKTTFLSKAVETLEGRGYSVYILPELVTELFSCGIKFGDRLSVDDFEMLAIFEQLHREDIYLKAAELSHGSRPVVIICDRGAGDIRSYVEDASKFDEWLAQVGTDWVSVRDRYDLVIHLTTAADGAEEFYEYENAARYDTPETSRIADKKMLSQWVGHPRVVIVGNATDFAGKMGRAEKALLNALGEQTVERARKYVARCPKADAAYIAERLTAMGIASDTVSISQVYLADAPDGKERRLRRIQTASGARMIYTEKGALPMAGERLERERIVDEREYEALLAAADTGSHAIEKKRVRFAYAGNYVEVDVFSGRELGDGEVLVEVGFVEGDDIGEVPELPGFFHDVIDVTEDSAYSNRELSRNGHGLRISCFEKVPEQMRPEIGRLLERCDADFVPSLSERDEGGLAACVDDAMGREMATCRDANGRLCGLLTFSRDVEMERGLGRASFIATIAVEPAFRRRGIATMLYEKALSEIGSDPVAVRTWSTNTGQMAMLPKLGFAEALRVPNERGIGVDTIYFLYRRELQVGCCISQLASVEFDMR